MLVGSPDNLAVLVVPTRVVSASTCVGMTRLPLLAVKASATGWCDMKYDTVVVFITLTARLLFTGGTSCLVLGF